VRIGTVLVVAESGVVTRRLLSIVRDEPDDHRLAAQICRACVEGLDVDGAALSVLTTTAGREALWTTDRVAEQLEDLQFSLNEGACIEAATSGRPVFVPDVRTGPEARRWPLFAAAVIEQTPVVALFALPLQWGAVNLGVLDLYRTTPGGLSAPQRRDVLTAADTAALMLLSLRTDPDHTGGWLNRSLGRRAEVHQATGMVLAQLGTSATDALARLRAYAFAQQRPLLDVARDVTERRLVFTEDMT
jgi:GAF domain-containing protein